MTGKPWVVRIDFDYDFYLPERPFALDLIGLGNILLYILGRKNFRPVDVLSSPEMGKKVFATRDRNDLSLLSQDRVFNLKKLYPSLPKCLNDILLHLSSGTSVMYDRLQSFTMTWQQVFSRSMVDGFNKLTCRQISLA